MLTALVAAMCILQLRLFNCFEPLIIKTKDYICHSWTYTMQRYSSQQCSKEVAPDFVSQSQENVLREMNVFHDTVCCSSVPWVLPYP